MFLNVRHDALRIVCILEGCEVGEDKSFGRVDLLISFQAQSKIQQQNVGDGYRHTE